jgi:hypothetical protein
MVGGIGREQLTAFYRDHFIFSNAADSALETVSRTIGADRVIGKDADASNEQKYQANLCSLFIRRVRLLSHT